MISISVDFETRSKIDLKAHGVYKYLEHPSTDVWLMSYAVGSEEPRVWYRGDPVPDVFLPRAPRCSHFRAHNAQFERLVWERICVPRYDFPVLPMDAWHCTAAEAAAMSLPRSLEGTAKVLRIAEQKDMEGNKLAGKMCRPRSINPDGTCVWWDDFAMIEQLALYCQQDVRVERAAKRHIRDLSPVEREVYLLNQRLNDRGIAVDMPLVRAAQRIVATGVQRANEEITRITSGAVTAITKTADLRAFTGLDSVRKAAVRDALAGTDPFALTAEQQRALELRAEAGRSSVAKLDTFERVVCNDGRVRGLLLYHGASTGRDSGKLVQPQNFPRPDMRNPEQFLPDVMAGNYDLIDAFHPPIAVIAALLRGCLTASPGMVLRVGDFAQVEARVLAWLAGQDDLVQLFASGGKVYEEMAAAIYRVPVETISKEDPRRQTGKWVVLGAGFQLGPKGYGEQVKENTGLQLSEEECKAHIGAYRERFPSIVQFWYALESACVQAVRQPGKGFTVSGNTFCKSGGYLVLRLRSGRCIFYPRPKIEEKSTKWGVKVGVTVEGESSYTHQWTRYSLYGGHLTENVVSALSRDLMWAAGLRLGRAGYNVLLAVHDELVTEFPSRLCPPMSEFERLMAQVPAWAKGCPIAVEAFQAERYRK